jgi:hypothetical protein
VDRSRRIAGENTRKRSDQERNVEKEKPVEARENERIRMEKTVGHECVNT